MLKSLLIILLVILINKLNFNFSFDYTRDGDLLLWYNYRQSRKYIKIW
jgi:hypothetical protein